MPWVGKAFWYKVMDLMHYAHLNLTSPVRGVVVINRADYAAAFYKGVDSVKSARSWERWKRRAVEENLLSSLPGDAAARASKFSSTAQPPNQRAVLPVERVQDAIYRILGAPHPSGLFDQVRCDAEDRNRLMPKVAQGIAAAARVEQRRRAAG